MKQPKTKAEIIEHLKYSMALRKLTPKRDGLVPEWMAAEMLHLSNENFIKIVLLDDCPLKPVHKAGARFYRLEDIAEFYETPE